MRRTKEQAAETRTAILRTAQSLFLQQGYEVVSMDQIALGAGVTRGALNWHFKNREGLLFAMRDDMRGPLDQLAATLQADAIANPFVALRDAIDRMLSALQADARQRAILRMLLRLDLIEDTEGIRMGRAFEEEERRSLVQIFETIAATGDLARPWTATSAATSLSILLRGIVAEWAKADTGFELVPHARDILDCMLHTYDARNASRDRGGA